MAIVITSKGEVKELENNTWKITIPVEYKEMVEERIEKTNRRLKKHGFEAIQVISRESCTKKVRVNDPMFIGFYHEYMQEFIIYTLRMFSFPNQGWNLLGVIDHKSGGAILLAPGVEEKPEWKSIDPLRCDHCHTQRERNKSIILQKEGEEQIQIVGSTCVEEYLGIDVTGHMLCITSYNDSMFLEDEIMDMFCHDDGTHDVYITHVALALSRNRWIYDKNSIHGEISNIQTKMEGKKIGADWHDFFGMRNLKEMQEKIKDIIDYVNTYMEKKPLESANDYDGFERNFIIAYWNRSRKLKNIYVGGVANIIRRYINAPTEEKIVSQHIGKEGDKITINVTITGIYATENQWGMGHFITMRDDAGNSLNWYSSSDIDLEKGHTYKIRGTIKKLGEYKGIKQTTLTRVKRMC